MTKKKIGILTFHRADNLGAVLQSYALQSAVEERYSASAQIVDYVCDGAESVRHASGMKGCLLKAYYWIKHRGFVQFRQKYLHLSALYTPQTIADMKEKYDAVIAGSDQVWNYECSGWDDAYFLNFLKGNEKKYSYAASLGKYRFTEEEKAKVKSYLETFEAVSVREEVAREHLESFTELPVRVSPDPVMLLSKERWQKVMSPRLMKGRYVFVYQILPDVHAMKAAEEYARKNHCKVISNKKSLQFILHGSPSDFLSWIFYADRVFTNSFHGTAFSLIFGKSLGVETELRDGSANHRVQEVLKKAGAGSECILRSGGACGAEVQAEAAVQAMAHEGYAYLAEICR